MSRAKHSATQTFISRLEHIRRNHQLAEIQKREQLQAKLKETLLDLKRQAQAQRELQQLAEDLQRLNLIS
jgi:RNase adaptor protein for sRNA GlmZ degradation